MLLLLLLGAVMVSLLGLSRVTVRGTSRAKLEAEARQNARLALKLAMGELQRLAGPDQRITARAEILDNTPTFMTTKLWPIPTGPGSGRAGSGTAPAILQTTRRKRTTASSVGWRPIPTPVGLIN